jgi:hypothetical protein
MSDLVGCEHCGFVAGTHGYGTDGYVDPSRGCPECGNRLRHMGPAEVRNLIREKQWAEIFRAQTASRRLGAKA